MVQGIANILLTDLFLLSLFGYWIHLRPNLLVDEFRENLFVVRNDLFITAADGKLKFNSEAYIELRQIINGFIRFGHKLTPLHVLLFYMLTKKHKVPNKFEESLQKVTDEEQIVLRKYRDEVYHVVILYLIKRSPSLFLARVGIILVGHIFQLYRSRLQEKISGIKKNYLLSMTSEASILGQLEKVA